MTLILGRRAWSFWAVALATMAAGMVFAGVVVWSFPGPPIGQILVFVGTPIALFVASRLWVGFGPEGVSVPRVVGRKHILAAQIVSLSVAQGQISTVPPTPSLVPRLHMADGSVSELKVLTGYVFVPGSRAAFERVMQAFATSLGKPIVS